MELKKNQPLSPASAHSENSTKSAPPATGSDPSLSPSSSSFARGWLRHLAVAALVPQTLLPASRAQASDVLARATPLVQLTPSGAIDLALEKFDGLDTSKNGFIGQAEVAAFAKRSDLTPNESQLTAALVGAYPGIVTTTLDLGDGLLAEWEISRGDLKKLGKQLGNLSQEVEGAHEARRFLLNDAGFERIDQNRDLALDRSEVARASASIDPRMKEVAQVLKASYSDIRGANNNRLPEEGIGITKDDLLYYSSKIVEEHGPKSAYLSMTSAIVESHRATSQRLANGSWDTLRPEFFEIIPEAVQQGRTGNCYFLASLLALSHVSPELIRSTISSPYQGSFVVQFPGDPSNTISVDIPSDVERALFAKARGPEHCWVPILEKAAGLYVQREGARHLGDYDGEVVMLPAQYIGGGGWAEHSLELLTGNKATRHDYRAGQAAATQPMEVVLAGAFAPGAQTAVVASTAYRGKECKVNEAGLVTSHAYAVLGYQVSPNGEHSFIIANPHGDNPRFKEAALILPLSLFQEHFDVIQTCPAPQMVMAKAE